MANNKSLGISMIYTVVVALVSLLELLGKKKFNIHTGYSNVEGILCAECVELGID